MEGMSNIPLNSGSNNASAPAADYPLQASKEQKSSSVPSMSGALQGGDAKDVQTTTDNVEESGVNGTVEVPVEAPDTVVKAATSTSVEGNSEIKDSSAPPATSDTAAEANGTPTTLKKSQNGKRKSTSGVPEHKTKKLNKKKSLSKITNLDAQPGEYYFARLKSYPPWPAIICDEGMLPHSLLSTRPVTTKQVDGTYKEAYADGGKRVHERTFPVMFLHTNEFAWMPNTELTKLDPEECKDFPEKGKTKSLVQAYHVAAERHDLEYFKNMLLDHQKAMQEDQERREAREAAKAEKAERAGKKKRKSEAAGADDDVDMEDAEEEGKPELQKTSKKRKKEAESEEDDEKPAKTPKTATKLKLTTPKAPGTGERKAKDTSKPSKAKPERKKSKAAASDEEAQEEVKEPEKALDPAEVKAKKEKEVLYLRHKLQKGFLSRDQAPQESEMATMSNFITKLEKYGDLEVSIIRSTKINKVLKALIKLNTIPKDEEFNFKSRSLELLAGWNKALGAESTGDDHAGPSGADKEEQPTTNGIHKEDNDSSEDKKGATSAAPPAAKDIETLPDAPAEIEEAIGEETPDGDGAIAEDTEKAIEETRAVGDEAFSATSEPS